MCLASGGCHERLAFPPFSKASRNRARAELTRRPGLILTLATVLRKPHPKVPPDRRVKALSHVICFIGPQTPAGSKPHR
jgi:hypothetical protein